MNQFLLKDNKAYFICNSSEILLSDKENDNKGIVKNALYTGDFKHHQGEFKLTENHLDDFISNFDKNVTGIEPAINYNHNIHDKASGWIKGIKKVSSTTGLSDDNLQTVSGLDLDVEWTPAGKESIRNGEYKYFSIEFSFDFVNSESQEKSNNVITGGALTNKPFLKSPEPVAFEEEKKKNERGNPMSTKQELLLSLKSDFDLDVLEDAKKLEASVKEVKKLSSELKASQTELSEMKKEFESKAIEALLSECVREGKILPAEKDMHQEMFCELGLEKSKAFTEKMQVKVKLEAKGSASNEGEEEELNYSQKVDKIALSISEKEKISYEDALPAALEKVGGQ